MRFTVPSFYEHFIDDALICVLGDAFFFSCQQPDLGSIDSLAQELLSMDDLHCP